MNYFVFIDNTNNKFTYACIAHKILDGYLKPENVVLFHSKESFIKETDDYGVVSRLDKVYDIEELVRFDFRTALKIHFLSLRSKNSDVIDVVINQLAVDPSRIFIIITDDEVSRWYGLYLAHGRLLPCIDNSVNEKTISLMSQLNNFICLYEPWGNMLETVLGRHVNISDFNAGFTPNSALRGIPLIERKDKRSFRVLFGAKPSSLQFDRQAAKAVVLFLFSSRKILRNSRVKFGFWSSHPIRMILRSPFSWLYCEIAKFVAFAGGRLLSIDIRFESLRVAPFNDYVQALSRFDFLILKARGSLGGSHLFRRMGGVVLFPTNSPNYRAIASLGAQSNFLVYNGLLDALQTALSKIDTYDDFVKKDRESLNARRDIMSRRIKEFYSTSESI
ncbi:hypothetical protein [Thiocapsa rosea]|nr:hypothetical protein [Thiocapsa rosea]